VTGRRPGPVRWPADHALGVELELNELVSRASEARRWHHDREADQLAPDIVRLQLVLADLADDLVSARPVFHGARRAGGPGRPH
jgi:hypothetical protein